MDLGGGELAKGHRAGKCGATVVMRIRRLQRRRGLASVSPPSPARGTVRAGHQRPVRRCVGCGWGGGSQREVCGEKRAAGQEHKKRDHQRGLSPGNYDAKHLREDVALDRELIAIAFECCALNSHLTQTLRHNLQDDGAAAASLRSPLQLRRAPRPSQPASSSCPASQQQEGGPCPSY